jgi:hypothetical protein
MLLLVDRKDVVFLCSLCIFNVSYNFWFIISVVYNIVYVKYKTEVKK